MEIKGLTPFSAPILEDTFFEIACTCSFQDRFIVYVESEIFAMICLVDFDANSKNIFITLSDLILNYDVIL